LIDLFVVIDQTAVRKTFDAPYPDIQPLSTFLEAVLKPLTGVKSHLLSVCSSYFLGKNPGYCLKNELCLHSKYAPFHLARGFKTAS
jgi:hypothetical protein